MNTNLYKIGFVSELLEISIQAIRHYEKKGLVKPSFVDKTSNYRYYSEDDIGKLWRIKVLKSSGLSLDDMMEMENMSLVDVSTHLKKQRDLLKERINQQNIALNYVTKQIKAIDKLSSNVCTSGDYNYLPDRYGQVISTTNDRNLIEHFKVLSKIKGKYGLHQEVVFQPSRLLSIDANRGVKLEYLFAIDEHNINHEYDNFVQKGGLYYCEAFKGLSGMDKKYNAIINKIRSDGFDIRGDAVEVLLMDSTLTNNNNYLLREIQVAVIK